MRYVITKQIREIIWKNRKLLYRSDFPYDYRNWLRFNKSIKKEHFDRLCSFLKLDPKKIKLKEFYFDYKKNLGTYAKVLPIRFKGVNENFAEFIGIMLGDGSLSKNRVAIIIDSREEQYRDYITSLFYDIFGINFRSYHAREGYHSLKLYVYGKDLVGLLEKFGLIVGNKVENNIGVPEWIFRKESYIISCVRGLMDTDGYLHYHKRDKQIVVGFTNLSENLIKDFMKITNDLGFNFTRHKKDVRLFRKDEVKRFLDTIKLANDRHLNKYDIFKREGVVC